MIWHIFPDKYQDLSKVPNTVCFPFSTMIRPRAITVSSFSPSSVRRQISASNPGFIWPLPFSFRMAAGLEVIPFTAVSSGIFSFCTHSRTSLRRQDAFSDTDSLIFPFCVENRHASLAVGGDGEPVAGYSHVQKSADAFAHTHFVADRLPVIDIFISGKSMVPPSFANSRHSSKRAALRFT